MTRLRAIIIKEIWALIRDPKTRIMLIAPPLLQLLVFSYSSTLEVKNVDIGVLNQSHGVHSSEIISQIAGSSNFRKIIRLQSRRDLRQKIDQQTVIAAIIFPSDFDARIDRGEATKVDAVLDGRRSNAAQIVSSYLTQIAASSGAQMGSGRKPPATPSVITNWFNPNLEYIWFNLPTLLAIIVAVSVMSLTAQTVARERELGTFDQLMVSPLRIHEILLGKMLPAFVVGFANGGIFFVAAQWLFGVPFTGSVPMFFLALFIFMLSLVGMGMFVSSLSVTQQQAFLGSFVVTIPMVLLSGFASPIENMPAWLQLVTTINPARYFVEISLGLFLKNMSPAQVTQLLWPLLAIGVVALALSAWLFRVRME